MQKIIKIIAIRNGLLRAWRNKKLSCYEYSIKSVMSSQSKCFVEALLEKNLQQYTCTRIAIYSSFIYHAMRRWTLGTTLCLKFFDESNSYSRAIHVSVTFWRLLSCVARDCWLLSLATKADILWDPCFNVVSIVRTSRWESNLRPHKR